ncbi:MAG: molecular chaperone [Symploca sp. SIO2B6]|nr:molecular chaperone [Symploca sp. SIO2B6]
MNFLFRQILLTLWLVLAAISPAFAFELIPISRVFAPAGSGSTQSYRIVNDKDEPIAVEISVVTRSMDLEGKESYTNAEDDFLIYPSQIILEGGQTQAVRVTWLGEPNPERELTYRLLAEQLPIEILQETEEKPEQRKGQIKVLLRYLGSIYIRPENVEPEVVLDRLQWQSTEDGKNELAITLHNQGTARAVLKNFALQLTVSGEKIELLPEQLENISNEVILSGNKRRFTIPWSSELPVGEIEGSFDF